MSDMDFSEMDGAFREAESDMGGDFDPVPDGSYQVIIDGVQFKWLQAKDSQKAASQVFEWTFKVINGPLRNRKIWKTNLIRPDLLKWLKTDVWKCGFQVTTLTALQRGLGNLLDKMVEIKVETKVVEGKHRQNVYIQRLITTEDAPASDAAKQQEPPPPEDDIPF
jgi:hypothetical protein